MALFRIKVDLPDPQIDTLNRPKPAPTHILFILNSWPTLSYVNCGLPRLTNFLPPQDIFNKVNSQRTPRPYFSNHERGGGRLRRKLRQECSQFRRGFELGNGIYSRALHRDRDLWCGGNRQDKRLHVPVCGANPGL